MRGFIFGFSLSYSFPVFKYEMGKQKEAYLLSWIRLWPSFSISNVLHGRMHLPLHQESISIDFVSAAASASTIQFVAKREKHTKLNVRTTCVPCRHHHAFHSDDATALSSHLRPDSVKKDVKVCEQQKKIESGFICVIRRYIHFSFRHLHRGQSRRVASQDGLRKQLVAECVFHPPPPPNKINGWLHGRRWRCLVFSHRPLDVEIIIFWIMGGQLITLVIVETRPTRFNKQAWRNHICP